MAGCVLVLLLVHDFAPALFKDLEQLQQQKSGRGIPARTLSDPYSTLIFFFSAHATAEAGGGYRAAVVWSSEATLMRLSQKVGAEGAGGFIS